VLLGVALLLLFYTVPAAVALYWSAGSGIALLAAAWARR
jgi:hypothetical protein